MQSRTSSQVQDNSHLTRYREDMNSRQKLLRDRLGLPHHSGPSSGSNSKLDRVPSIPSIDGDNTINEKIIQERDYRSSRSSFFTDNAEESLQFFKKNLLNKESNRSYQPNTSYTPSKPLTRNPISSNAYNNRIKEMQDNASKSRSNNSLYRVDSAKTPAELYTKRTYSTNKVSPPTNQTALGEPQAARVKRHDVQYEPRANTTNQRDSSRNRNYTRQTEHREKNFQSTDIDELGYNTTSNGRTSSPASANHKSESKQTDVKQFVAGTRERHSPEPFSRKGPYNSLLRAHDSIRLKVNRPKVRPKTDAKIEDTVIDDSDDVPNNDYHDANESNERAIDVKRSSLRKSKKKGSSKQNEPEETIPLRNFSDVHEIKLVRGDGERSLGVTVKVDSGNIVVARIMAGRLADKQGVLQVGDIILSVNNREVYTPEQLQEELRRSINDDVVNMKIVPSFREELPVLCIYLRALFSYDPNNDSLLPCKEVGVSFNQGDILEVVNQEDPNWWQARRVDSENLETGLIPSQELEERRRAFVLPDFDLATRTSICGTRVTRKSKRKEIYNIGQNNDFDKAELQLYEEVCRTPPFERRTLVLIGANGVGKQALKARLITMEPKRFGAPLAHTSRLPRDGEEDGVHYHFVTREMMEDDIISGRYLEYGEYDGALYGTKLDSVREIIGSGKICILDCSPTCLKILKTPDYLPFVAFIAAPAIDQLRYMQDWSRASVRGNYSTFERSMSRQSRRAKTLQDFAYDFFEDEDLQVTIDESARLFRIYEKHFDVVLVNQNHDRTFEQLRDAIDALSMAPQWIPISWIYGN